MSRAQSTRIFLSFIAPFLGLLFFSVIIFSYLGQPQNLLEYALVSFLALLSACIIQFLIFKGLVLSRLHAADKVQEAFDSQKAGNEQLIHRDEELLAANEKLRELDQIKSNFISIVAHQLRTPLSAIKWSLNMVVTGQLGPITDEQKFFLSKSYESNERIIGLVSNMLSADSTDSDKLKYDLVPTQIFDLLDNVLYEMVPLISEKNIKIDLVEKNNKDFPKVLVDQEKFRAVLQNLIENAVKYTPKDGTITIDFRVEGNFIQVCVKDSGIGIPPDQVKNVFNRFFRARNAMKAQTDGSGLGLFISKNIVEKHGGRIWFDTEMGKGSTFYFTVPVAK